MAPMLPFVVPIAASAVGAGITGLMNRGANKMASMPSIPSPQVGDPDKTPGHISNPGLFNAASQNKLSSNNTTGGRLLGG